MFLPFLEALRAARVPLSLRAFLTLLEAMPGGANEHWNAESGETWPAA